MTTAPQEFVIDDTHDGAALGDAVVSRRRRQSPIEFENEVSYKHYQILFPTLRDNGNGYCMQIAEVERLGLP